MTAYDDFMKVIAFQKQVQMRSDDEDICIFFIWEMLRFLFSA